MCLFVPLSDKPHQLFVSVKDPRKQSDISLYTDSLRARYTRGLSSSEWLPAYASNYINLAAIVEEHPSRKFRHHNLHGSLDTLEGKTSIAMQDILKPNQMGGHTYPVKHLLIEGAPGIGKSTFAWEMCQKWGQYKLFNEYSLVILLKFRDRSVQEAKNIYDLFYCAFSELQSDTVHYIVSSGGHGLLLIFEGFNEAPVSKQTLDSIFVRLFTGQELPNATVIMTTRPSAGTKLRDVCRGENSRRIKIIGFGEKEVEEYIRCAISDEQSQADLKEYLSMYPHIHSMMYVPLNSAIVTWVYKSCKSSCAVPKTMTQLYSSLIRTLLLYYLKDKEEYKDTCTNIKSFKDLPQRVYDQFCEICEIAYTAITKEEMELRFQDLPSDFDTLGLMQTCSELFVDREACVSYNFLHLTIQEYLAAYHISLQTKDEQLAFMKEHMENETFKVLVRFLSELSEYIPVQVAQKEFKTLNTKLLPQGHQNLPLTIAQCAIVGVPKSGKSSLMRRLLKQTNFDKVFFNICAVTAHDMEWMVLDWKNEGDIPIHSTLKSQEATGRSQLPVSSNETHSASTSMSVDNQRVLENSHSTRELLPAKMSELQPILSASGNMQQPFPGTTIVTNEVSELRKNRKKLNYSHLIDKLLDVSKGTAAKDYVHDLGFIHLIDSGGQPEFLELLPALVSQAFIFFLVFDLRHAAEGLDKEFSAKNSDGSFYNPPFGVSTISTRDVILQTLASIYEMGFHIDSDKMQQVFIQKVLLVGTHSDHVTDVSVRNRIDDAIQKLLVDTPYYKSGMLVVPKRERPNRRFVYIVNNEFAEDPVFEEIREKVNSILFRDSGGSNYKKDIPPSWLGFYLKMRQPGGPQVLKYEQCMHIASRCSIEENDVQHVLEFLHKQLGVIKYFKDVAGLRDIVIADPQLVFDAVSGLIKSVSCNNPNLTPAQREEIQDRGLLSVQVIDQLAVQGRVNHPLSLHHLLKLFSHLHIAVPLDAKEYQPETMYFMPCLLQCAKPDPLQPTREPLVAELLIVFDGGYCPKGLFTILAATLAAKSTQPATKYTWLLNRKRLYKNQVSFHISEKDLGLLCTYTAYIYQCWEDQSQSIFKIFLEKLHPHLNSHAQRDFRCLAGVCKEIRLSIQSGIVSSLQKLNCIQEFKFGFYSTCDTTKNTNGKHIGVIPAYMHHPSKSDVPKNVVGLECLPVSGVSGAMFCLDCQKFVCPFRDDHKVWLMEFQVRMQ